MPVSLPAIWLGVIAFLGMLAGAIYAVTTPSFGLPGGTRRDPREGEAALTGPSRTE